jgi:RNA polymerase subunit RPABC4/transcription elongation factor Spt4
VTCPACQATSPQGSKFCPSCGGSLVPVAHKCAECGAELADGAKFCPTCGKPTAAPDATPPAAP